MAQTEAIGPRPAAGLAWPGRRGEALERFLGSNGIPLLLAWPCLALVLMLSLFIFYMTFVPELPTQPGWTLAHWSRLASPYLLGSVLPNTIIVGVGTVLVTLVFAAPLAWLLNRTNIPLRRTFITLIAVVVIVPGFVKAMGWLLLLQGRIGLINKLLMDTFSLRTPPLDISGSPLGMAWVMGLMLAPTMFFLIAGPMRALDPALEEAASVAGSSRWRTVMRISLPLVWPATLGGAIYIFMTAISIFEVPALLGGMGGQSPVLATEMFFAVNPPSATSGPAYGAAGVYGMLITLPSIIALYYYLRIIDQSHRYQVITGKGYRPQDFDLGRYTWLALAFVFVYLTLAVFLPMAVLLWASFLPVLRLPSPYAVSLMTLENYRDFWAIIGGWEVIRNTIVLVVSVSVLVVIFSFMNSWVVVRSRLKIRKAMDVIAMLPHAIPGLGFAFALMMIGILASRWVPWLPLSGTITIIVLANLMNRLAYGTRITNAALLQVAPELEESARVCGARSLGTMARIVAPLVAPSLVYAGLWTALLTFREVSMALMLTEAGNVVLGTRVFIMWRQGALNEAAAAAVIMVVVLGVLLFLAQLVTGGRIGEQRRSEASLGPIR